MLGAAVAAVVIVVAARGNVDAMVYGDGAIHRYVAEHIAASPDEIDPRVAEVGTSLRYGRIGLPGAIWFLSAGSPALMRYVQPLIMVIAGGAAAAAVAALLPAAPAGAGLLIFAIPGFVLALTGGYAEVLALALAAWAMRRALDERWASAAALFGLAILTKENAGALLLATAAWMLFVRRRPRAWWLLGGLAIPGSWHVYVWIRYGHLPLLDPYVLGPTFFDAPIVGLIRSIAAPFSGEARAVALLHVALALAVIPIARRSLFGFAALFAALQLLSASPWAWRFIGDAFRISTFIEAAAALTLVASLRPAWVDPAAMRGPPQG